MTIRTVGVGKTYATITAAVTAAVAGDTIQVDAGTYLNNSITVTKNLTFQGVGGAFVVCDSNQNTVNDKAYFVIQAQVSFDAFEFRNAIGSSGNIAGIRYESGTLTCTNCWLHDNQNGLFAVANNVAGAFITINRCEINNNGTGSGSTHNIYVGLIPQFTITNCFVHDAVGGTNGANELKSRAVRTDVTSTRIYGGVTTAYEVDFPDGGICNVSGCTIQQSANSNNSNITEIGQENTTPASHPTNSATFLNCIIVNDKNPANLFLNSQNFTYSWQNTQIYTVPVLTLPATMSNNTILSARPTLDVSHPWLIVSTVSGQGIATGVSTVSGISPVVGATIRTVGTGKTYATIQAAYAAAVAGDTIQVDAGTYLDINLSIFKNLSFVCNPANSFVVIDSTAPLVNDEAYFKTSANVSFDHFEIRNGTGPGGIVAGIRYKGIGNLTCTNCWFHNNQDGILIDPNASGTVTIDKCEFDHNGTGSGLTHNFYCGIIGHLIVTNSYFHDVVGGNEFKSRALISDISNSRIHGMSDNANWEMDFPIGGVCSITNCVIQQSANTQNNNMTNIGAEVPGAAANPTNSINFQRCTVINDRATVGTLFYNPQNFPYTWNLTNIWKVDILDLPAVMTNTTNLSVRPTLDTSHPWAFNTLTVGVGKQYSTIQAAYTAAVNGDTIVVDAGVYNNVSMTIAKNITFKCVDGFAVLDSNQNTANDKAYLIVQGTVSIDHFEFRNARGVSSNCVGVRFESGNLNCTNCWFHNNQMGFIAADNSYVGICSFDRCEFNNNGINNGSTHNFYAGSIAQLQVTNCYFHDCIGGNEFKSRAKQTDVSSSRIHGMDGNSSWELDFPTGGLNSVSNSVIQQSVNSANSNMTNMGAEGLDLTHTNSITFYNNLVINDIPLRGILFSNPDPTNITYSWDNTAIWSVNYLELPANMTNNNIRGPARPTLDLSHPWLDGPNIGNSQGISIVRAFTPNGSIGLATGIATVSGIVPIGSGPNKLYTSDRSIPAAGATGAVTSTHPNNGIAAWRSLLIGVEAAQVVNPITIARAGTAAGTSSVSAIGSYGPFTFIAHGNAAGLSSVNAVGRTLFTFSAVGNSAGLSSVNANGAYGPFAFPVVGNASGLTSVNAVGRTLFTFSAVGNSAGVSSVNANGAYGPFTFAAKGTSTGVSSVNAISSIAAFTFPAIGNASGLTSVNANGAYGPFAFPAVGSSTGLSSVNAITAFGPSSFPAKGTAVGLSSVNATGAYGAFTFPAVGNSVGLSSVNAITAFGPSVFPAIGIAAGLSSVNANGNYGLLLPAVGTSIALASVFANSQIIFTVSSLGFSTGLVSAAAVGFSVNPPPPPPPDNGPGTSFDWTIHPEVNITFVVNVVDKES